MFTFINPLHARQQPSDIFNLISEGMLSPFIETARASSKTFIDSDKTMRTTANNIAAFDNRYLAKGLSIHPTKTNSWRTKNLLSSSVTKSNVTVATSSEESPLRNDTLFLLTATQDNNVARIYEFINNFTAETRISISATFKKGTENAYLGLVHGSTVFAYAKIDLDAGTITGTSGTVFTEMIALHNGCYRVSLSAVSPAGSSTTLYGEIGVWNGDADAFNRPTCDSGDTVYAGEPQIEYGYPSPYIETNGVTASREADALTINGDEFDAIYNQDAFSVLIDWYDPQGNTEDYRGVISIGDGTTANRIELFLYIGNRNLRVSQGGNSTVSETLTGITQTGRQIDILTLDKDSFDYYLNGIKRINDDSVTLPVNVGRMALGNVSYNNTTQMQGYIARAVYYPYKLSESQALILSASHKDFLTEGDSYMAGANGIGIAQSLTDSGYDIVQAAIGGATLEAAVQRIEASPLAGSKTIILCDGSPNGNSGVITTEIAKYQRAYNASNGNIIIATPMVYSGLAGQTDDQFVLDLSAALITTFGASKVVNSTAVARTLSGVTFTNTTDADDAGYYNAAYDALFQTDNVHMGQGLSDALSAAIIAKL